ncbi:TonB-dependent hemoglobin/transferrin/lactoferrin family receptor [Maricaulis maris]|uniref:TonB-dependent hemoglobin/transferrin/lactoferrin family receptor n=1 Tax=Maricaulis maris TaxID=74318 RepID=UPI003A8E2C78
MTVSTLALVAASSAQAQGYDLGTLILTTDRAGNTVLQFPGTVDVIDAERLKSRNISDIEELVRRIPGVTVSRQTTSADPFSTFGGFTIRGVGGNRVAIQVDGSRTPERIIDGTRDYVDLNFTKSVEIVRGPASVLWGADALGGLVAFETLDPEDLLEGRDRGGAVSVGHDSFDTTTSGSFSIAQRFSDQFSVMAGLARESGHEAQLSKARDDGGIYGCPRNLDFGATPCGELDPADHTSTRALAKMVWTPNAAHRLEFSIDALDRQTSVQQDYVLGPVFSSSSGAPTGEVIRDKDRHLDLTRNRYALEHTWSSSGVITEVVSTLAWSDHDYLRTGTELSTSAAGEEIRKKDRLAFSEDFLELDIQARAEFVTGGASHRMVFGLDADRAETDYRRVDRTTNLTTGVTTEARAGGFNFANATTTRADLYVEDRIGLLGDRLEITPGLRFATYRIEPRVDGDYQPVPGKEPGVREEQRLLKSLALTYHLNDSWSVWGKYGEGFKMPTAQQLYTSRPGTFFTLIPAPDLKPEEVKSYELGLRYEDDRGFAGISAFKADYSEFIQSFYNPPGTNDYTYRNISVVNVQGIEASFGRSIGENTQIEVSAAWQEGTQKIDPSAKETPHTLPPFTATFGLAHQFDNPRLRLEGVLTAAADVKDTASDTDFKPKGYSVLDLHAKWEVIDNGFLNLSVNNVFDRRYFTAGAASYGQTASASVARANPIELQTGPGRTFAVSFDMTF